MIELVIQLVRRDENHRQLDTAHFLGNDGKHYGEYILPIKMPIVDGIRLADIARAAIERELNESS